MKNFHSWLNDLTVELRMNAVLEQPEIVDREEKLGVYKEEATITIEQVVMHPEFTFSGDFDIWSLVKEMIGDELADIMDCCFLNDKLDYDGSLHQAVDGMIDIYYHDIRKWAVDNWDYVEEAMDEGITESITDYHELIQAGQYVYYREKLDKELNSFVEEFNRVLEIIQE